MPAQQRTAIAPIVMECRPIVICDCARGLYRAVQIQGDVLFLLQYRTCCSVQSSPVACPLYIRPSLNVGYTIYY